MHAKFNQIHSEFVRKIDFHRQFLNQVEIGKNSQLQLSRNKRDEVSNMLMIISYFWKES